jgi:hypothetical protein
MQGRSGVIDRARRGGEAAAGVVAFIETAVTGNGSGDDHDLGSSRPRDCFSLRKPRDGDTVYQAAVSKPGIALQGRTVKLAGPENRSPREASSQPISSPTRHHQPGRDGT